MGRVLTWGFWLLLVLYVTALFLFAVGTLGWFGQEKEPLAGVFLIPLGLPWVRFLDGFSEGARPWLATLSPALNLLIIGVLMPLAKRK